MWCRRPDQLHPAGTALSSVWTNCIDSPTWTWTCKARTAPARLPAVALLLLGMLPKSLGKAAWFVLCVTRICALCYQDLCSSCCFPVCNKTAAHCRCLRGSFPVSIVTLPSYRIFIGNTGRLTEGPQSTLCSCALGRWSGLQHGEMGSGEGMPLQGLLLRKHRAANPVHCQCSFLSKDMVFSRGKCIMCLVVSVNTHGSV